MNTGVAIVDFIAARAADDERSARNAGGHTLSGRWIQPDVSHRPGLIKDGMGETIAYDQGGIDLAALDVEVAEHIVRHDPNRVMVFVDVVRQLVADHTPHRVQPAGLVCARCRLAFPCWTVRTLAMVWCWHPDYRPGWTLHGPADTPDPHDV